MSPKKQKHPTEKAELHARNKHRNRYDFEALIQSCRELKAFVKLNNYNDLSIDFFNPAAVKALNKALLSHYYDVENWDIPTNYLCPPIPGRADYIHYIADLLSVCNHGKIPLGEKIKILDIGVGANCIYPILGSREYQWSFIGADIDVVAIKSAQKIVGSNSLLKGKIEVRLQNNAQKIFEGILLKHELIDVSICNPPFHASHQEAQLGSIRKLNNLTKQKITQPILNFGGQNNELWCEGGEKKFIINMIQQSKLFSTSCFWFTTLISNKDHLKIIYEKLQKIKVHEVKIFEMKQGNKTSRIVAWTFLNAEQQLAWVNARWS